MFTGLVEAVGTVVQLRSAGGSARLLADIGRMAEGVAVGDSVCVDGACLTVARVDGAMAEFDVSSETLGRTTLGHLRQSSRVNLERAMRAGGRFGGHFVLGHVDGVGKIAAMRPAAGQTMLEVAAAREIVSRLVPKGSVAVDGISLTVAGVTDERFRVALIPHTLNNTNLPAKSMGDEVNLELDVIGKYVERLLAARQGGEAPSGGGLTEGFLEEHGFK